MLDHVKRSRNIVKITILESDQDVLDPTNVDLVISTFWSKILGTK